MGFLENEMKGYTTYLKKQRVELERDKLLAELAMTIMSPRDFMENYPALHEKIQPIGSDFKIFDSIISTCGIIGYISNFSGDLFEVKAFGECGNYNFDRSKIKHYYDPNESVYQRITLNEFLEGRK